jgi:hypothetical protein
MNLSEWPKDSIRAAKKMERMSEELDDREMPPTKYTVIHTDARLTDDQRKKLMQWLDDTAAKLKAASPAQ